MGKHVSLLGARPTAEVLELMTRADAFLLTSKTSRDGDQEGTPTALIEAQSLGLPCISTFHAGIPEVIPADNHFLLAQEGDISAIAQSISRLIKIEPAELARVCETAKAHVFRFHDLERETRKLLGLYSSILGSPEATEQQTRARIRK
jgi:colanic acid/amylovoran biosynthesis glycosyltransferase